jgi:hypothetical protein
VLLAPQLGSQLAVALHLRALPIANVGSSSSWIAPPGRPAHPDQN